MTQNESRVFSPALSVPVQQHKLQKTCAAVGLPTLQYSTFTPLRFGFVVFREGASLCCQAALKPWAQEIPAIASHCIQIRFCVLIFLSQNAVW